MLLSNLFIQNLRNEDNQNDHNSTNNNNTINNNNNKTYLPTINITSDFDEFRNNNNNSFNKYNNVNSNNNNNNNNNSGFSSPSLNDLLNFSLNNSTIPARLSFSSSSLPSPSFSKPANEELDIEDNIIINNNNKNNNFNNNINNQQSSPVHFGSELSSSCGSISRRTLSPLSFQCSSPKQITHPSPPICFSSSSLKSSGNILETNSIKQNSPKNSFSSHSPNFSSSSPRFHSSSSPLYPSSPVIQCSSLGNSFSNLSFNNEGTNDFLNLSSNDSSCSPSSSSSSSSSSPVITLPNVFQLYNESNNNNNNNNSNNNEINNSNNFIKNKNYRKLKNSSNINNNNYNNNKNEINNPKVQKSPNLIGFGGSNNNLNHNNAYHNNNNVNNNNSLSLQLIKNRYECDHSFCKKTFSSPQSRSNHYSLKHSKRCEDSETCAQCKRTLKIQNSPKSKCRHFGCEKICSSANLAKHEKTPHHKVNFLDKFNCNKCDELSTNTCKYSLPPCSTIIQN